MTDDKIRGLRERLDAIAPLPADDAVTAGALARHFAVRAQERWTRQMSGGTGLDHGQLSTMCAEFAAAHALHAMASLSAPHAGITAAQIRDALEDGGGIGEWLWEHLGEETARQVAGLAEELAAAQDELAAEAVSTDA